METEIGVVALWKGGHLKRLHVTVADLSPVNLDHTHDQVTQGLMRRRRTKGTREKESLPSLLFPIASWLPLTTLLLLIESLKDLRMRMNTSMRFSQYCM